MCSLNADRCSLKNLSFESTDIVFQKQSNVSGKMIYRTTLMHPFYHKIDFVFHFRIAAIRLGRFSSIFPLPWRRSKLLCFSTFSSLFLIWPRLTFWIKLGFFQNIYSETVGIFLNYRSLDLIRLFLENTHKIDEKTIIHLLIAQLYVPKIAVQEKQLGSVKKKENGLVSFQDMLHFFSSDCEWVYWCKLEGRI